MSQFVAGIVVLIVGIAIFLAARGAKAKAASGFGLPANATPAQRAAAAAAPRAGQLVSFAAMAFGLFTFGSSFVRVVPANTVGIPTALGKVSAPLNAGLHVTVPWTEITEFSTRTQELSMLRASDEGDKTKDDSVSIIAKGGGSMAVDVTVRFALALDQAGELFKQAGSLALVKDRFVRPDAREVVRNVFGQYTAEEGYSIKRGEIAVKITDELKPRLAARGILVDSVNVRDVAPDTQQLAAINAILQSRNEAAKALEDQKKQSTEAETRKQVAALDKDAAVTKAEAEAAAVQLAATAQAEANAKIAKSLTPELLDLEKTKACAAAIAQTKAQVVNVCAGSSASGGSAPATSVIVDTRNPATPPTPSK